METSKVIGEIIKNARGEKVVVTEIFEEDELKFIDIRQGYLTDEGDFILTKKGIRLKAEKISELKEILNQIKD